MIFSLVRLFQRKIKIFNEKNDMIINFYPFLEKNACMAVMSDFIPIQKANAKRDLGFYFAHKLTLDHFVVVVQHTCGQSAHFSNQS